MSDHEKIGFLVEQRAYRVNKKLLRVDNGDADIVSIAGFFHYDSSLLGYLFISCLPDLLSLSGSNRQRKYGYTQIFRSRDLLQEVIQLLRPSDFGLKDPSNKTPI